LPRDAIVLTGGAVGVDRVAEDEARIQRISRMVLEPIARPNQTKTEYVAALWDRNRRIAEMCDRMTAFWDGRSPGTRGTFEMARELGKPVEIRS